MPNPEESNSSTVVYLHLNPALHPSVGGQPNENEFKDRAERMATSHGVPTGNLRMFSSGNEILRIVKDYRTISKLCIFAHGVPSGIGSFWTGGGYGIFAYPKRGGWVSITEFCEALEPRLTDSAFIGLAACLCGLGLKRDRNPRIEDWEQPINSGTIYRYNISGRHSFAYKLRDQLTSISGKTIQVRAHTTPGPATENPFCIAFTSPAGGLGTYLLRDAFNHNSTGNHNKTNAVTAFANYFRGELAEQWILGGSANIVNHDNLEFINPDFVDNESSPALLPFSGGVTANSNTTVASSAGSTFVNEVSASPIVDGETLLASNLNGWADTRRASLNNSNRRR